MLYTKHMDETLRKGIYLNPGEDRSFLMEVSTTKNPLFDCGDTVVVPGGREFRYGKSNSAGIISPNLGVHFTDTGYVAATAFAISYAAGVRTVNVPAATHAALAKDELVGGYLVVGNGGTNTKTLTYEIVANDASILNVAFNVTIDMPLGVAIVAATSYAEVYLNPWTVLSQANSEVLTFAGAAVNYVEDGDYYFWVQTKGIKFISPNVGVGATNGGLVAYWITNGSMNPADTALGITTATGSTCQPAGTVIAGSSSGNGPMINLQGY